MKLKAPNLGHVGLISLYWSRYAVRSGSGLVYLLIALVFGLSVAHILMMPAEKLIAQQEREMGHTDPQDIRDIIIVIGKPVTQWILGQKTLNELFEESAARQFSLMNDTPLTEEEEKKATGFNPWLSFLLEKKPALLSVIFLVLLFGMPFVISFLGYNQMSGDIQSHGLRYLLLRTERRNIYFGRFLGTAIFSTAVMALIVATITFYLGMKTRIYPAAALAAWAAYGFVALSILMLPYIALCSLISASVDSPFLSLVLAKVTIAGILLLGMLGSNAWKPAKYLMYALPWGWQSNLLHPAAFRWVGAGLACLVYAGLFLMLGYYRFERRDL